MNLIKNFKMKKMNVIPLIMSVFLLFSCTEQEQVISEPTAEKTIAKENQEKGKEYLLAQQVFYAASLEKIEQLQYELAELSEKKESGDKEAINEIEETQKEIQKYKTASDYFYAMRPPKGPRPIGPMPPVGCRNPKANCNPIITNLKQIIIGDNELEVHKLVVEDAERQVVAKVQMGEGKYGRTVNMEVEEFKGQATMHVELSIENKTNLLFDIPARGY